jgi:hypothetical protein
MLLHSNQFLSSSFSFSFSATDKGLSRLPDPNTLESITRLMIRVEYSGLLEMKPTTTTPSDSGGGSGGGREIWDLGEAEEEVGGADSGGGGRIKTRMED